MRVASVRYAERTGCAQAPPETAAPAAGSEPSTASRNGPGASAARPDGIEAGAFVDASLKSGLIRVFKRFWRIQLPKHL